MLTLTIPTLVPNPTLWSLTLNSDDRNLAATYGRTALCLSGGAGNGFYHIGVVKAALFLELPKR